MIPRWQNHLLNGITKASFPTCVICTFTTFNVRLKVPGLSCFARDFACGCQVRNLRLTWLLSLSGLKCLFFFLLGHNEKLDQVREIADGSCVPVHQLMPIDSKVLLDFTLTGAGITKRTPKKAEHS
eukprot:Rmarinus@m.23108